MAARKMQIDFGLMSLACRRESAVQAKTELKNLCVGQEGYEAHPPTPLKQDPSYCPGCGPILDRGALVKGHGSGESWTIVSAEDQAALAEVKFTGSNSTSLSLVVHPAGEFLGATETGEAVYYVWPEESSADHYALLAKVIEAHPELAFAGLFSLSTGGENKLWLVRAREGVLILEQRTREQSLKPAPEVTGTVNDALLGMVEATLDKFVVPYDATAYEDAYETAVKAAVASGVTSDGATPVAKSSDEDLMAKLSALAGK